MQILLKQINRKIVIMRVARLQGVENYLGVWRAIILTLTIIMLLISFIEDDEMAIVVLIICFFALILFRLKRLPVTSYQLFILLQLGYLIYMSGILLQTLYYRPETPVSYICKIVYSILTLVVFMVVLWRHYQKEQLDTVFNNQNQAE